MMSSRAREHASQDNRLDLVFQALADRTRRALLARLARRTSKVTDLAAPFNMSLPAVSRHIRVLERARLVRRTIDGRVHRCSLSAEPLHEAKAWLEHYRPFWKGTLEALANYVERE
jgi:DNA-binding transcriptional ArsR family regulator